MTLADTLFVGRLGASALAGVSLGGVFVFTLLCFGFGLLRSVKVLVSQAVGAQQDHRVAGFVGAGLVIAVVLGVANIGVGWLGSGLLAHISSSAEAAVQTEVYVKVRVLGAPLALAAVALREARYGTGDTKTPMRAALVANLVNIVLDYGFICGLGWGVAGAAWGSVAAHCIDFAWLARAQGRATMGLGRRAWKSVGAVWRLGVPIGLQMVLEVSAFAVLTAIFSAMSEVDVASHQIALVAVHFSFLPALALGEAASVMAGQAIGARHGELVAVVARRALWAALAYTGLCGVVFAAAARPIATAFTDDPAIIETTTNLLYVAAAFQLFDGASIVARCVLRGTGDVRFAAVVSVVLAWVTTPPLAMALGFGLGMGAVGGWVGLSVEIMLSAAVLWWRLERGGWQSAARKTREQFDAPPPSSGRLQPATS
ncbi:MAG: MATE family efflux transporter [Deltaproteobacteria bacterium]|nr:MATE family efflux transporter [Deltaproteobacteria bacterium]